MLESLGYLSKLRVDRTYRNYLSILRGGYAFLRELHPSLGCKLYLTSIFTDNLPARRFLERGLPGLPTYRPVETFETLVMPARQRFSWGEHGPRDVRDQVAESLARNSPRFQFAPRWLSEDLCAPDRARGLEVDDFFTSSTSRGAGRGCLALWDQRAYKQVVVRGYDPKLARMRPLVNAWATLAGRPRLPDVGEPLKIGYVSHLAIDNDEPDLFYDLLCEASGHAAYRGLDYFAVGLSSRHPLLPVAKRWSRHRRSVATLYVVHWEDGAEAAASLDGRVAHYEVALL